MDDNNNNKPEDSQEELQRQIKTLNTWMLVLIACIAVYSIGILVLIDKKASEYIKSSQVYVLDPTTMRISSQYSNIFHSISTELEQELNEDSIVSTNNISPPMFIRKDKHEVGDFVIIRFFYIQAVISEVNGGGMYTLMYKDHNRVMRNITLDNQFILSPVSPYSVNPMSFLSD
jgi:hypothetical protein